MGFTVKLFPVPASVPPQLEVYHFQLAPAPNLPPVADNVVEVPKQIVVVPDIEVAGNDVSSETIVFLAQVVESQLLFALTKNESVADMLTVIDVPDPRKVFPVPKPQPPLNHCHEEPAPSEPPVTVKVTDVP